MMTTSLLSFGAIFALIFYEKLESWKFLLLFLIISFGIDSYFGNFLGTYFIALVAMILFHYIAKISLPYDRIYVRFPVLLFSFAIFHFIYILLSTYQSGTVGLDDLTQYLLGIFVRALLESGLLILFSYLIETYLGSNLRSVRLKV